MKLCLKILERENKFSIRGSRRRRSIRRSLEETLKLNVTKLSRGLNARLWDRVGSLIKFLQKNLASVGKSVEVDGLQASSRLILIQDSHESSTRDICSQ